MSRRSSQHRAEVDHKDRNYGRWRLRNWPLRGKLLVMLLIPSLATIGLLSVGVHRELVAANGFQGNVVRVRIEMQMNTLIHRLQHERSRTVEHVAADRSGDPEQMRHQQEEVDKAIGEFDRRLRSHRDELPSPALDRFERIQHRLEDLTEIRYLAADGSESTESVLDAYSDLLTQLLRVRGQAVLDGAADEMNNTWLATAALGREKNLLSLRWALVVEALEQGWLPQEQERALLSTQAELESARAEFRTFATPDQQRDSEELLSDSAAEAGAAMTTSLLDRNATGQGFEGFDAGGGETASAELASQLKQRQDDLLDEIRKHSDALAEDAYHSAVTNAVIVAAVLLIAVTWALLVARSLLRPLRILRRDALDVAEQQLPAAVEDILNDPDPRPENAYQRNVRPVPVFSREEVGQVARAFDAVHSEAVRLAAQQAMLRENINAMFVNLSRRSQDLVERQLTRLDQMEEHEQDPDTLGGLFELDHLATRMRRNNENLLVLAGQDGGPVLPEPVVAEEVIGAALSEVEYYQRIKVRSVPELAVHGAAVSDVIHVIAELFDNATRYSDEEEPVSVVTWVTSQGEWRVDITDLGAGMPDTEIRRVNAQLAEPPEFDVDVSRRMGLYVVARLADRQQLRVRLRAADLRGLTATVFVPAALIEAAVPESLPEAAAPGTFGGHADSSGVADVSAEVDDAGAAEVDDAGAADVDTDVEPAPIAQPEYPDSAAPFTSSPEWPMVELDGPRSSRQEQEQPSHEEWHDPEATCPIPMQAAPPPEREPGPLWPREDVDRLPHPLGDEAPTDRMPAYQEVLSRWFQSGRGDTGEYGSRLVRGR